MGGVVGYRPKAQHAGHGGGGHSFSSNMEMCYLDIALYIAGLDPTLDGSSGLQAQLK